MKAVHAGAQVIIDARVNLPGHSSSAIAERKCINDELQLIEKSENLIGSRPIPTMRSKVIRIRRQILARSTLCLMAALLLPACAGSGVRVAASECTRPPTADSQYIIGPGDILNIVVWRNSELSASIPVRPDGRISTPLIDDMLASGKTPSELAADMETVLAEYLRSPEVSVIVSDQGAANQIQVIGQVVNPQTMAYRDGLRILDVVVAVGGLSEFAAGNRSHLVRPIENASIECRVRIEDLLRGDLRDNIEVFPGDVLVIPETRF